MSPFFFPRRDYSTNKASTGTQLLGQFLGECSEIKTIVLLLSRGLERGYCTQCSLEYPIILYWKDRETRDNHRANWIVESCRSMCTECVNAAGSSEMQGPS